MTDTATGPQFQMELKRKDKDGNVLETTTIMPDGTEETNPGEA
jgi:hypothetical protein